MKKILKLLVGITACVILFLYLFIPFVQINGESFNFSEYLNQVIANISSTLKNQELTQVDMFYIVVVWLVMLVIICVPVGCLIIVSFKALLSGVLTRRNLTLITLETISFVFSAGLIIFTYNLVYKYSLPADATALQKTFVELACSHIWQPLLYISAFGSLFLVGVNLFANGVKNKKEEPKEE